MYENDIFQIQRNIEIITNRQKNRVGYLKVDLNDEINNKK